ncbi:MAG: hypothetical protein CM1200mP2_26010 [Planctomycetaceae bacterium]|nr:MAG: hypothetical protein CM1200mP2_26010 [Planctomycetaceae bacterium]
MGRWQAGLPAQPTDPPDIGAICEYLGLGSGEMPAAICLPNYPGEGQKYRRGGPYGGFLGSQYDPLFSVFSPKFDREPPRRTTTRSCRSGIRRCRHWIRCHR